jgi:hypothetical protein
MANEFIARNGLIALDNSRITGSLNISGSLSVNNTPAVLGSGTTNRILKLTASSTAGDSLIFDNGTNVLIGTTTTPTPVVGVAFPLTVTSANTTRIRIDSTQATPNSGFGLYANSVQKWSIAMFGATSDFTIYNDALLASAILVKGGSSNVLIGTTTDAGFKLDVNGTGRFSSYVFGANFNSTVARSNTIDVGTTTNNANYNFIGNGGWWGIRTNLSNEFNIDTYFGGSPKQVLNIAQSGAATFSSSVTAGGSGNVGLILKQNTSVERFKFFVGSGTPFIADDSYISSNNADIHFLAGGLGTTEIVTFKLGGNVGIGTTSPTRKLEVSQTGDAFINIRGSYFNNSGIIFSDIDLNQESCAIRNDRVNNAIWFSTGGINSERMRITSGGNVLIGKTTDDGRGKLQVSFAKTQEVASFFNTNNASSGDFAIVTNLGINALNTNSYHYIAGTGISDRFYVYGNGTFATVSDQRLKKNISTVKEKYLENVLSLNVVNYNWKDQPDNHSLELGLIAQEVETLFPFIIHENRPDLFGNVYKSVQVSALPYILIKAIQEQQTQIESLKSTLQRNNIL